MQYTFTTDNDYLADTIIGVSRIVENSAMVDSEPSLAFTYETAMSIRNLMTCIRQTLSDYKLDTNLLPNEMEAWLAAADRLEQAAQAIRESAKP